MVDPGVARQAALARRRLGRVGPVTERRRDDGARLAVEQQLGVARDLRLRHRELHPGEEAALAALADVLLGLVVGLGRRRADRRRSRAPRLRVRARRPSCEDSAREGDPDPRGRRARCAPVRGRSRSGAGRRPGPRPARSRVAQPPRCVGAHGPPFRAEAPDPGSGRCRSRRGARLGSRRLRRRRPGRAQPGPRARAHDLGARRAFRRHPLRADRGRRRAGVRARRRADVRAGGGVPARLRDRLPDARHARRPCSRASGC